MFCDCVECLDKWAKLSLEFAAGQIFDEVWSELQASLDFETCTNRCGGVAACGGQAGGFLWRNLRRGALAWRRKLRAVRGENKNKKICFAVSEAA